MRTIGSSAFQRTGITSADLSSPKLEVIDDFAFSECTQLAALTLDLDSALSAIGSNAFQLTALTSFTVPANVTMLGNDVVSGCPLSSMTFLSAEAPHLNFYHSKPIYLYQKLDSNENVLGPDPDFRVVLAGDAAGHEMDYLFAWRDAMSPFDQDPYETDLAGRREQRPPGAGAGAGDGDHPRPQRGRTARAARTAGNARKCQKFRKCPSFLKAPLRAARRSSQRHPLHRSPPLNRNSPKDPAKTAKPMRPTKTRIPTRNSRKMTRMRLMPRLRRRANSHDNRTV